MTGIKTFISCEICLKDQEVLTLESVFPGVNHISLDKGGHRSTWRICAVCAEKIEAAIKELQKA